MSINIKETDYPRIEDIRVMVDENGEEYINIRDLTVVMRMMAYKTAPTLSVFNFIKQTTIELLTARR